MKLHKLSSIILLSLFFTCNNEPYESGFISEEEEQDIDNTFVDKEGNLYYTGGGCEQGSPIYSVHDNVVEGLEIPDDLPFEFDLSEFLPPVNSQGEQGSCTSWAVSYYMKSMQERIESGEPHVLSPSYTYNQITQGNCIGTDISTTLEILKEKGLCSWNTFPYTDTECATQPNAVQHEVAAAYKISDYKGLSGNNMVAEMKTLLTQQTSIIISTTISTEFGRRDAFGEAAYREHVVNYEETGCHTMLVVGYNNFENAFKVVNSWGTDWGNAGFVWIDYKAFENVADDNATFRVINGAFIAYDAEP